MAFNPNQPRNEDGEWTDAGGKRQKRIGSKTAAFGKGAIKGGSIGAAIGGTVGAIAGGAAVSSLPVLIPGGVVAGAFHGAGVGARAGAVIGGIGGLVNRHKRAIKKQHAMDTGHLLRKK